MTDGPLYGWEARTMYVQCEATTRGQAKAQVAWEIGEAYVDMRCRRVWLHFRELTEDDAEQVWLDDWYPGYKAWIGCHPSDTGAVAWWEVTWPCYHMSA